MRFHATAVLEPVSRNGVFSNRERPRSQQRFKQVNFLAHIYLSSSTPESILGAVLGDFVKGRLGDRFTPGVREAIRVHRAIDSYSDAHPVVRESRRLVSGARRRFAPILIDLFYDHLLARDWARYSSVPLADFTRSAYVVLGAQAHAFPETFQRVVPRMAAEDWLAAYGELDGIERALAGLSRRARRGEVLLGGVEELTRNYAALEDQFRAFFAELREEVAEWNNERRMLDVER